jgi:carbonic anhydrase
MTADQALARLIEGNERFIRGGARFPTVQKDILAELAKGQQPYATILGCSDSRVPPELVFDAGFGELFIVRVAGNVISAENHGNAAVRGHAPADAALCRDGTQRLRCREGRAGNEGARRLASCSNALLLENIYPALEHVDRTLSPDRSIRRRRRSQRALVDAASARDPGSPSAREARADEAGRLPFTISRPAASASFPEP